MNTDPQSVEFDALLIHFVSNFLHLHISSSLIEATAITRKVGRGICFSFLASFPSVVFPLDSFEGHLSVIILS